MRANRQTVIVVTLAMEIDRRAADRVVIMDHGEIVAAGPPERWSGGTDVPRPTEVLRNAHRRDG